MSIYCEHCNHEASYVEPDENMIPYLENGYYECQNPECDNNRITDGTHEGNRFNWYYEI